MKIATTKTTVADLLTLLADADPSEEVSFTKATKKTPTPCWCGCGGTTKSKFVPGHDSRFHGLAKRVARGQEDHADALIGLAHDEARTEFEAHVEAERPRHEAKEAEKATKKANREAEKATKKAEKAAEKNTETVTEEAASETVTEEAASEAEVAFFSDIA